MSKVVYLIGAGASYGQRKKNNVGEDIPGEIVRGLPIVSELDVAIDLYCSSISTRTYRSDSSIVSDYPCLLKELRWLREMCKTYPTIDTYAKKLAVTSDSYNLIRLKNALSAYFVLTQDHNKRDLRYDGFVASIIQDDGTLPKDVSVLSWNYDCQMEYVLRDFSSSKSDMYQLWKNKGIVCKGFDLPIDCSRFNLVKLNGTALFSTDNGRFLIERKSYELAEFEKKCKDDYLSWRNNLSFAWEKDDQFYDSILSLVSDVETLVVIGYSFPYVNRTIDRKLIQRMNDLKIVYIQDKAASDVQQSFETLLSSNQQNSLKINELLIRPRTAVNQFIIPNELT